MVRRFRVSAFLLAGAMAAAPVASQAQDLLLEAELEPARVFVQAQAIYRLRFYQAVDVRELKIIGPSARLAEVRAIGSGRVYEALRDGRRYRVHERSYAVSPFGSGALELTGAGATGRVAAGANRSADGRQPVRLEVAAQTLTVSPVPAAAGTAAWLPATSLSLSESWSAPATALRPGQVLWRSIRIEAAGIDAAQIPPLSPLSLAVPGMLVDAKPPRLENRGAGALNIGVREQTLRMVALRAGEVQLPELQLHWWNLEANTLATATLSSRALHIESADADSTLANVLPLIVAPVTTPPAPKRSQFLFAAGFTLFFVVALNAYVWRRGVCAAWRLQRACRLRNAGAVRDGMLEWAAVIWPKRPPLTLQALAERLSDPATRRALSIIERNLYGPNSGSCSAATLDAVVRDVKRGSRQLRRPHSWQDGSHSA